MCEKLLIHPPPPLPATDSMEGACCHWESWWAKSVRTILLVEPRDEVFARLASDLAAAGIRAARATGATEAIRRYVHRPTDLLLVHADQPGESAWLLAAKLHLTHPRARIWVYASRMSSFAVAAANCLMVEELIEYRHDASRLVAEILDRLEVSAHGPALFSNDGGRTSGAPSAA